MNAADHLAASKADMRACDRLVFETEWIPDDRPEVHQARERLHDAEEHVIEAERAIAAALAGIAAKAAEYDLLEREQMAQGVSRWQDIYNGRAAGLRLALELLKTHHGGAEKGGEA